MCRTDIEPSHSCSHSVACRSLFHGSDEDEVVGFEGDLDDFDMDGVEDECVHPSFSINK